MRSAALLEALELGLPVFPLLRVAWTARGLDLGAAGYAPEGAALDGVQIKGIVQSGGWDPIEYGSGVAGDGNELEAVETKVGVIDREGELLEMLETYDPRGSAASIDWASPRLMAEDWEPLFRGVVADWQRDGIITWVMVKTDDTVLRSPVPSDVFQRTEWGSASESSIYGTQLPMHFGIHDVWKVTGRGMLNAVNIRYDATTGYWWLASVDRHIDIPRIVFDGHPQGNAGWVIVRGVYGNRFLTIISILEGFQPSKGVIVSFDAFGPDENGLTDGDTLTGVPDQLRVVLNEYVYREAPLNGWRGDVAQIHADSWDLASEFFALHRYESARAFGGEQEPESGAGVVQTYLEAHIWTRLFWNELGQIEHLIIDPDDIDPDPEAWIDLQKHNEGGQLPYEPGDMKEVYSHVKMPFMWSQSESKFLSEYQAHDVAALAEKVVATIENLWSPGRLSQETPINPAPPPDPPES